MGMLAMLDLLFCSFTNCYSSKILKINDDDDDLLALIIANMPDSLRKDVIDTIDCVYKGHLKHVDSKKNGEKHEFESIHFLYFNSYSKRVCEVLHYCTFLFNLIQGDNTPSNIDPAATTTEKGRRLNSARFIPRCSKEFEEHIDEYQLLHEALEPLFIWLQSIVCFSFNIIY